MLGNVRFIGGRVLFSALLVLSIPALAQPALASDDPDLRALLAARAAAETAIGQGDLVLAGDRLVQSFRACPPDRVELADAVYGSGQLASYVFLHLMAEADFDDYLVSRLDPDTYITDKMVRVLCSIAAGLDSEQKTVLSREASYLTASDHAIVRVITMFFLSNPYFYDNAPFTNQFAEALGRDYPNLELTQVSLNLGLYNAQKADGIEGLAVALGDPTAKSLPYAPWSEGLRERIRQSGAALARKSAVNREAALAPLLEGVEQARDWRERHFALVLLKSELDGPLRGRLCAAAERLAARKANTPDVLQARALLAKARSADCQADPDDSAALADTVELAYTLLEAGVDEPTPERVLWETWVYGLRDCAENLAAAGHHEAAIDLYTALADRIPGSVIARDCQVARDALFHHKPLSVSGAAE